MNWDNSTQSWKLTGNQTFVNIYSLTNNETNLNDWINYWKYCESAQSNRTLEKIRWLKPTQELFCGSLELGIPISHESNLYCHCITGNYFAPKCNRNYTNYSVALIYQYGVISLTCLVIIVSTFIVALPKIVQSFKMKKLLSLNTILNNIIAMIFILVTVIRLIYKPFDSVNSIIEALILLFSLSSLLLWLLKYVRIIIYIKNRQYPTYTKLFYLAVYVFILSMCVLLLPLIHYFYQSIEPIFMSLGLMILISFFLGSLIVFILLRKVTDVNIAKTSFVKFVLFIFAFDIVFASVWYYFNMTVGVSVMIKYLLLIFLCSSISFMEFEKEEFDLIYNFEHFKNCCKKSTNKETSKNEMSENFISNSDRELQSQYSQQ